MQTKFDTSIPHIHVCFICRQSVHCRAINCDISKYAECYECKKGISYIIPGGRNYGQYIPRIVVYKRKDQDEE